MFFLAIWPPKATYAVSGDLEACRRPKPGAIAEQSTERPRGFRFSWHEQRLAFPSDETDGMADVPRVPYIASGERGDRDASLAKRLRLDEEIE